MLVDDNELDLMADPHSKTNLREGCAPISWQLGLLCIEPSLPPCNVVQISVAPELRTVMESSLKLKEEKLILI